MSRVIVLHFLCPTVLSFQWPFFHPLLATRVQYCLCPDTCLNDASVLCPPTRRSRVEHNAVDYAIRLEQRDFAIVQKIDIWEASSNMSPPYFPKSFQPSAVCTIPSYSLISVWSASQINQSQSSLKQVSLLDPKPTHIPLQQPWVSAFPFPATSLSRALPIMNPLTGMAPHRQDPLLVLPCVRPRPSTSRLLEPAQPRRSGPQVLTPPPTSYVRAQVAQARRLS